VARLDSRANFTAERLLAAAKMDNEGMLEEAIAELEDINGTDGYVFLPV
jgi:hypothetical protein